ncbi:MAG: carboxypeptidase regulatory-like domain-containing protein [Maioricimonas sp. JB045]|uniref:carboxypeptidase regulatory-like domain-containing protein n=1 Tax=Maioricimonas sp. JC845 TaxID=3232138 RepID=UPI0034574691
MIRNTGMRAAAAVAMLLSLAAAGCGGSSGDKWTEGRPETIPVTGVVTLNGEPLADATISFEPQGGDHAAYGRTDEEGRFELTTFEDGDGAVAGGYVVSVRKSEVVTTPNPQDPNGPPIKSEQINYVPEKYTRSRTSGLDAIVSAEGENEFTFELEGQPG